MKLLRAILDFYINTSIHVAIAVFSLVQITKIALNISTNVNLDWFIFFGTIISYNFLKYCEVFRNKVYTIKKNYDVIIVSFFACIGLCLCLLKVENNILIELLKIGFLVLFYPLLRKFWFLKMFVVAFTVTYITYYIPCISCNFNWIYFGQRFVLIICLLIPLEIVDLPQDTKTIRTLPKIIGIGNLKKVGYFLLIVFCFLDLYFLKLNFEIDIVIAIIIAFFIFNASNKVSKYYTSFWVESIPIVLLLFYYLLRL